MFSITKTAEEAGGRLHSLKVVLVDGVHEFNPDETYENFTKPKGLALIFNNVKFTRSSKLAERTGSDLDAQNLSLLLKKLGYEVKVKLNRTAEEMKKDLHRFSRKREHAKLDSAIVFVLSHGASGVFYGRDGVAVDIEKDFVPKLDSHNCPNLRHKPKLFFIQACRGANLDAGDAASGIEQLHESDLPDAPDCPGTKIAALADTFIAYSTTSSFQSWRNCDDGTWFVQAIWEVFSKRAAYDDLLSMMTKVNQFVSEKTSSTGCKQISEPCSRLTKKFFFFPGFSSVDHPSFTFTSVHRSSQRILSHSFIPELKQFYLTFGSLNLLPLDPSPLVPLEDIWVNLETCFKLEASSADFQACLRKAKALGYPVIVQGEPGSGKSTLVKKICHSWAKNPSELHQYSLVLMAQLRDVAKASTLPELCLQWLAQHGVTSADTLTALSDEIAALPSSQVLIILDGLDENIPDCPQLHKILKLDSATFKFPLLITTRPYKSFNINITTNHHSCYIIGLSLSRQITYTQKFFAVQGRENEAEEFITHLSSNVNLQRALSTPLLLKLSLATWDSTTVCRQTDLYTAICSVLVATYSKKHPDAVIDDVNNWMPHKCIKQLCRLAFDGMVKPEESKLNFTESDLIQYDIPAEHAKIGFLTRSASPGQNSSIDYTRCRDKVSFSFLHKTMQEFFAALHLLDDMDYQNSSLSQFMEMLQNDHCLRMRCQQVIIFLFGLLCSKMPDKTETLMKIVDMDIFPYTADNLVFFTNLRNESIYPHQKDMINKKIQRNFHFGWADISVKFLLGEHLFPTEMIAKGIHDWKTRRNPSSQTDILVLDGYELESDTILDPTVGAKIKGYELLFYDGPESVISNLCQYLNEDTHAIKVHLSHADPKAKISWPVMEKLSHVTFSQEERQFPLLSLVTVKSVISSAKNLTSITLLNCSDAESLAGIKDLPSSLEKIRIKNSEFSSKAVQMLASQLPYWKKLETFNMYDCHMTADCVVQLVSSLCPTLTSLSINGIPGLFANDNVPEQLVGQIERFSQLHFLGLQNCGLDDSDVDRLVAVFPKLSKLNYVRLGWNNVSPGKKADLLEVCKLRNITVLFGFMKYNDSQVFCGPYW